MRNFLVFLLLPLAGCTSIQQTEQFATDTFIAGEPGNFHGFAMYSFVYQDRQCRIVAPRRAAEGNPWLWRARFFGHRPEVDLALLNKGFYVAYMDVADLYGNPAAVDLWDDFYELLTNRYHFAPRAALEGMSRGGLMVFNWTLAHPERVACIYADAPVCDLKSWPGGLMEGVGSPEDWQKSQQAYGLTEAEAVAFRASPVDRATELAKTGVPLLVVSGDQDTVVPYAENAAVLVAAYQEQGSRVKTIIKRGEGHVHGLNNASPIVRFVVKHAKP
ncbi:MAG: prolyl oligopeptidase family serine peptidase [Tunicatimonas sp.]